MTVSSTTNTTSAASTTSGNQLAITNGGDLQNTFMKLLVAQLQNQDPLNPMDNSQMTSQLAQINTVNGIQQLNTTMSSMLTQNATTQASSMIGRTVQVPTNNLTLASGAANFGVSVPNGADHVVVTITNAAGVAVRTVDLGQMAAGSGNYTWNGKDDKGNQLADGAYSIKVSATQGGKVVTGNALGIDKVAGVTINNGTMQLVLASGGTAKLSDVASIQ